MPDKRIRNAILCLQVIAETLLNQQQKLFICFIDFVKALDKVRHYELLDALNGTDVDDKDSVFFKISIGSKKTAVKVGTKKRIVLMWTLVFDKVVLRHHCSTTSSLRE